ncbi:hypothetical protein AB0M36_30130 [Actinoplanes sp. NPDC051346]|uniref:hypothetical protein n=1 Tax=Actinoplanes sp. NPDC051346 TaxID=3155048 RepID=UPI00343A5AEA
MSSGSDPHLLALLRAMRLRSAAPEAAAAGEADAAAALQDRLHSREADARDRPDSVHPEELVHPEWPARESRTELPAAHPFRELSAPGISQPDEAEQLDAVREQGAEAAGGFRAGVAPVPSGPRWTPPQNPRGPVAEPGTPSADTPAPADSAATTPVPTPPGGTPPVATPPVPSPSGGIPLGTILPDFDGTIPTYPPSADEASNLPPGTDDAAPARPPGTFTPRTTPFGATPRGTSMPNTAVPGTAVPGTAVPGTAVPGTDPRGTAVPGLDPRGAVLPGTTPPATTPAGTSRRGTTAPGGVGSGTVGLGGIDLGAGGADPTGAPGLAPGTIPPRPAPAGGTLPGGGSGTPRPPIADVDPGHLMDLLPQDLGHAGPTPGRPYPVAPVPGTPPPTLPGTPPPATGPGTFPPAPGAGSGPLPAVRPGSGQPLPAVPPLPGAPVAGPGTSLPAVPPAPGTQPAVPGASPPGLAPTGSGALPPAASGAVPAVPTRRPTIPYPPGPGPWSAAIPAGATEAIGGIPAIGSPRLVGPAWQGDQLSPIAPLPPVRPPAAGRAPAPVDGMDPADDAELHAVQRLLTSSLSLAGGQIEVATRLRAALVQAEPALFARLPGGPLAQIEQLAEGLSWLVNSIDQPPTLVAGFGRLGAALAECGVAPQQLQLAGAALAEAMRAGMTANGWRQDYDQAWRSTWQHAYEWILHGMRAAQYQPVTWTAVVVSHERRRDDLAVVRLRPYLPMPYRPGQYARIEVPELPGVWRPYSLAGAPRRDNIVELHVRAKSLDGVSGTLVHRMRVGDKVKIWRAEGDMSLPAEGRDLLMIAGDTGVAPLKALLTELAETNDPRSAVLFWGVRTLDELYDIEALVEVAHAARRATVVPVISEGPAGPYASGLVTDAVAAYGEWSGHEVYLAGPPVMLAATSLALHELGVAPERIHHDQPE